MISTRRFLTLTSLVLVVAGCSHDMTLETTQPVVALEGTWTFTLNSNPSWGYSCTGDLENGLPPVCTRFVADILQGDGTFHAVNLRVPDGADSCDLLSLTGTVSGDELSGILRYVCDGNGRRTGAAGPLELAFTGSAHLESAIPYLHIHPAHMKSHGDRGACSLSTFLYTGRPLGGPI